MPWMPESTSFWATTEPVFGSAWSSSETSTNLTSLPPIFGLVAFMSSMARTTPFCMSLPYCAWPPVIGAAKPSLISCACAKAACAAVRPATAMATVMAVFWNVELISSPWVPLGA
ncbi:hypothetical protein D3C85_1279290 [compost metagenome]